MKENAKTPDEKLNALTEKFEHNQRQLHFSQSPYFLFLKKKKKSYFFRLTTCN